MDILQEQLGCALSVKQVAQFLNVDPKTVRKYYRQLGGVRLGHTYRFFEKELINAVQTWKQVDRASNEKGQEEVQDLPEQIGGESLGGKTEKIDRDQGDRHNLIVALG